MAVVLKKRAMAEYSQVIQEQQIDPPPVKKLRLKLRPPVARTPTLSIEGATKPLNVLLAFEQLPPPGVGCVNESVRQLLELLYNATDVTVQVKAIAMLGDLARSPTFDPTQLIGELIAMVTPQKSQKFIAQLLSTLCRIGRSLSDHVPIRRQLVTVALDNLSSSSHVVRCNSLELIGLLGSPGQQLQAANQSETRNLARVLQEFTHDCDSRVRTSALKALLSWHQRDIRLEQTVYGEATVALVDDYEQVRLVAIKLVFVISQLYPDSLVKLKIKSEERIRLVDDGFANICNMVNDLSMEVRTAAASLLGSLHAVSPRFLEQTLDKKLMSNMRRKMNAHDRQRVQYQTGGWTSGQQWADDRPLEAVAADDVSLIASGACGAFIHGLEDEFMEVRNAALDSLCELASRSAPFAALSEDFMVDMFNDEIESVRLNAIGSLRKICHHMRLREDQLDIILNLLKDFSFEIRDALRDMFCCARLGTKDSLNVCVMALLDNVTRYPQDKCSIWRCMKSLGENQPEFTLPLVPTLLSTHPYFDSLEPDIDDPAYIAVLILVFAAARHNSVIATLFPGHISRHYRFLRQSLPHLIPQLHFSGSGEVSASGLQLPGIETGSAATEFLSQTMSRLADLSHMDRGAAEQLMLLAIRDLERVADVDEDLAATAQCGAMFLSCQLCLSQVLNSPTWHSQADVTVASKTVAEKVGRLALQMEHLFVGLSTANICAIRQLSLCVHALHLVAELTTNAAGCAVAVSLFEKITEKTGELLLSADVAGDPTTRALFAVDLRRSPQTLLPAVVSALECHRAAPLAPLCHLQRAQAMLLQPSGDSDHEIAFGAGLALGVDVVADISNVVAVHRIRVKLEYPDHQSHLVAVRPSDLRPLCRLRHRLQTEVAVSHGLWTDAGHVAVSVVLLCQPAGAAASPAAGPTAGPTHVQLCAPVTVHVMPKPHRR